MAIKSLVSSAWEEIDDLQVPVDSAYEQADHANALVDSAWEEVWGSGEFIIADSGAMMLDGEWYFGSYSSNCYVRIYGNFKAGASYTLTMQRDGGSGYFKIYGHYASSSSSLDSVGFDPILWSDTLKIYACTFTPTENMDWIRVYYVAYAEDDSAYASDIAINGEVCIWS